MLLSCERGSVDGSDGGTRRLLPICERSSLGTVDVEVRWRSLLRALLSTLPLPLPPCDCGAAANNGCRQDGHWLLSLLFELNHLKIHECPKIW